MSVFDPKSGLESRKCCYLAELFEANEFKREDREESLSVQSSGDGDFLAALYHYEQKLLGAMPRVLSYHSATVRKLTACIGEDGYFTNHSLRRTCATRLYENGLDKQRIMAFTGHRSKDGVRTYKISCAQEPPHISVASKPSRFTCNISGHITINH